MAQPISGVILYNAKINHNGLFNCDFGGSGASRDSVMGGSSNVATYKFGYSNCTYIRKDKVITVGENADVLDNAGVNYCRYMNPQFSGVRYIYAFVDKIEYVAPETSRLHIRTDVFMTWFDKIDWGIQFVERNNISYGSNIVLEGGGTIQTEVLSNMAYADAICQDSERIGISNLWPYEPGEGERNGLILVNLAKPLAHTSTATSPACSGLPQGTYWVAVIAENFARFAEILSGPNDTSQSEAHEGVTIKDVLGFYYVPSDYIDLGDSHTISAEDDVWGGASVDYYEFSINYEMGRGSVLRYVETSQRDTTMFNGYSPKSLFLLRYPYNYMKITDRKGHEWILKPELFNGDQSKVYYRSYFAIGDGVTAAIKLEDYSGSLDSKLCVFSSFPEISAAADSYQLYQAMNKNQLQNQKDWRVWDTALSLSSSIIKTGSADDAGGIISGITGFGTGLYNYYKGEAAVEARDKDLRNLPNSIIGSPSNPLLLMLEEAGLYIEYWSISADAARKLDAMFDIFGYGLNTQMNTKPWTRKSIYGFVKTQNCHITGEIPEDDRAELDRLFDSGMTVWRSASTYGTRDYQNNNTT